MRSVHESLAELTDDEHSMCDVAARYGIYCGGFSQWTFEELKQRYEWIADRRPGITRLKLERLANLWQLARQQVHDTRLSCDSQSIEHDTCEGFDGWDNETLARYLYELEGLRVHVLPDQDVDD
jgi:hypothetical protein